MLLKKLHYRLRSKLDYLIYVFQKNKAKGILNVIEYLLFLWSVISIIKALLYYMSQNPLDIVFSCAGAAAFLFGVALDHVNFRQYAQYSLKCDKLPEYFGAITPDPAEEPSDYKQYGLTVNAKKRHTEYIFMSECLNKYLWDLSIPLKSHLNTAKETRVKTIISSGWNTLYLFLANNLSQALKNGQFFFNETKLCMGDGFRIRVNHGKKEIYVDCKRGSYYDTFLTNGVYNKYLQKKVDNTDAKNAKEAFPDIFVYSETKCLETFNASYMNNEFGISTIALTADSKIFLLVQSHRAMSSNMLIAPSGSGSCDFKDRVNDDLRKTLTYAMQRELWEETGFSSPRKKRREIIEQFGETRLIGFFRWIDKCGKPEFLGITRINKPFNDIKRLNTTEVMTDPVLEDTITTVPEMKRYLQRMEDETRIQWQTLEGVSIPTLACVKALRLLCQDAKIEKEIADFWRLK